MARPSADDKLIKENPQASPYELLQMGLSQKKYDELVAQSAPKPVQPEIKQVHPRLVGTLKTATSNHSTGMSYLVNLNTGNRIRMTTSAAQRMVNKNPKLFQIQ